MTAAALVYSDRRSTGRMRALRLIRQCAAFVLLLLLAAPIFWTLVLVFLELGRPIFFVQQRVGLHRRNFSILKFRTMTNERDREGALLTDSLRQTAVTRLLRRTRLDELPQIAAILWGDMAFIGPRPLLPVTVAEMGKLGEIRCSALPGLTGWAQVNGNTRLTDHQKLSLDIWYIEHRSLRLDLLIVWLTLVTIVRGEKINHYNLQLAEKYLAQRAAGIELADPHSPCAPR